MTALTNYIDVDLAIKLATFVVAGLIGMLYAYYRRWSFDISDTGLFQYMFGDPHATGRAITTFIAMCVGAGGLSYLDGLTMNQIVIAGAGIGLLVPQNVEQREGK